MQEFAARKLHGCLPIAYSVCRHANSDGSGLSPADRIQQVRACAALLSSYLSLAALTAVGHVYRCGYFTRLSTSSTTPPPDPAGLLHFSSSPETVIVLVCSAPIQFGNVLCSILSVKVLSATE